MESRTQKIFYLFWIFFKGMLFAFTSGMAAIPTIERGIVDKKKWLTHEEFWTYPVLGQSLPGVISIHNAMLIGNRIAGPAGSAAALVGVIAPALFFMLMIAALFQTFAENPYIQGAIRGIRVISIVLIFGNAIRLLGTIQLHIFSIILAAAAALLPLIFGLSPFWTIIGCGIAGIISIYIGHGEPDDSSPAQEIDAE